jgi:hypothetical protein
MPQGEIAAQGCREHRQRRIAAPEHGNRAHERERHEKTEAHFRNALDRIEHWRPFHAAPRFS